jgi:hypothetical protein
MQFASFVLLPFAGSHKSAKSFLCRLPAAVERGYCLLSR